MPEEGPKPSRGPRIPPIEIVRGSGVFVRLGISEGAVRNAFQRTQENRDLMRDVELKPGGEIPDLPSKPKGPDS